jgi:hypothetical protein
MLNKTYKLSISALMAVGIGASPLLPLLIPQTAAAQIYIQNSNRVIPAGTILPLREPSGQRIIVAPDETADVTLVTTEAVRGPRGGVLIPRGTRVRGEFRPTNGGTAFYARRIELRNGDRPITGRTNVVNNRRTIRRGTNTDPIWQGALVGGGAAVLISTLVGGGPGLFKTLGGAGVGALAGWLIAGRSRGSADVVVINRNAPLDLRIDNDLFVDRVRY